MNHNFGKVFGLPRVLGEQLGGAGGGKRRGVCIVDDGTISGAGFDRRRFQLSIRHADSTSARRRPAGYRRFDRRSDSRFEPSHRDTHMDGRSRSRPADFLE